MWVKAGYWDVTVSGYTSGVTFPDFTRHFFSSLTETVDGLFEGRTDSIDTSEKAVLLYLTLSF